MNKICFIRLVLITILILATIDFESIAQNDLSENKWLRDQISELEIMKTKSSGKIKSIQDDLQKCERTIKKSQDLISKAQEQSNRQAEKIANDALFKAYDAKKKNQDLLEFEKINLDLIEKKISEFNLLLLELEVMETGGKGECDKLIVQLERDKRALKNFMKTLRLTENEREEWTKEGKEAMIDAGTSLLKFIAGEVVAELTEREGKILKIKKEIDRYKKLKESELIKNKYLIDRMEGKLIKAQDLYKQLSIKKTLDLTLKTGSMIKTIEQDIELSKSLMEKGDKEIVELLSDNEVKNKLLDIGDSFSDLFIDYELAIRKSSDFFKMMNPILRKLPDMLDMIYSVTKVSLSSDIVAQLSEVAEQELKAVDSLKKQIERTNQRLKDCKKKSNK